MWTPECKRLVFGGLGAGQRIGHPKPNGHNNQQRSELDMSSFFWWSIGTVGFCCEFFTHDFGAELVWLLYFYWSGPSMRSLHRYLRVTETSTTFNCETAAQLAAHWTATTNLQSFKILFVHRSLRCKIMEVLFWKTYLWMQQLLLDTLKYKDCNFEFRHFFVNFGHSCATLAPCTKSTIAFRFDHSIVRRSELGNLKVLRSTWWRFRNGSVWKIWKISYPTP